MLVLEPEFITPQDGHEKQDCQRAAIKRWVKRNGARYQAYQYTLVGNDLYACQPICELFLEQAFNFILVCKLDSCIALDEQVYFLDRLEQVDQLSVRH